MLRLGFEQDNLTVVQLESLEKALPVRTHLVPVTGLVERLRMVKDAGEIACIRASVIANSRALESGAEAVQNRHEGIGTGGRDRLSESQAGRRRRRRSIRSSRRGNARLCPMRTPGATKIGPGILLIDMGAFRDGYASDMTRMVHVGPATPKYKRAYRAVLEAQLAAIAAVKPGATASAVDRAARSTLKRHGLEREFVHSTGHGLGLEIHEPPRIGRKDKTKLEAGMAITIEPGVYIEGWGGIRIEDTVLVTAERVRDPYAHDERAARDLTRLEVAFPVCAKLFLRWWATTRSHAGS